jgi:colicin import membrane protein
MSAAAVFEDRPDPGRTASALLSAAVHLALLVFLIFGVQWQNRPPETIAVELWEPPPPAPAVEAPQPVPKVEPPPVVKPEPEVVKPEPAVPKPEIIEKKAPPLKPKPVAKVEPKPTPKPVPVKPVAKAEPKLAPKAAPARPRVDETRRFQEELQREQASLAVDRERQRIRDQAASDATAVRNKTMADWVGKVAAKVRGNVVLPPEIKGNPEAIFDVVQLPTGEVLQVKLRKSSGHRALDDAIERAILKSSPLPKPDRSESAPRAFELKYRPLD